MTWSNKPFTSCRKVLRWSTINFTSMVLIWWKLSNNTVLIEKITHLPKIGSTIKESQTTFQCSHCKSRLQGFLYLLLLYEEFPFFVVVLYEVLKHDVHLETSSAFDIPIIRSLYREKKIDKTFSSSVTDTNGLPVHSIHFGSDQWRVWKCNSGSGQYEWAWIMRKDQKRRKKVKVGIGLQRRRTGIMNFTSRLGIRYDEIKRLAIKTLRRIQVPVEDVALFHQHRHWRQCLLLENEFE